MTEIFSASRPDMVRRWASSSTGSPVSTYSESQRKGTFIGSCPWELATGHGMPCRYSPSGRLAVWPARRLAGSRLSGTRELAQEAKIVAGESAHVVDAGTHHGQTLDTEPEGKAAVD